jgi:hypothetical protein
MNFVVFEKTLNDYKRYDFDENKSKNIDTELLFSIRYLLIVEYFLLSLRNQYFNAYILLSTIILTSFVITTNFWVNKNITIAKAFETNNSVLNSKEIESVKN